MTSPVVSVVTPSYNQAPFLRRTIESVLRQDYPHIEYVVMDGGSTDESPEILREYDRRLAYWTSTPDNGQADAIQRGWQRTRGDILAWLNSDDTYAPGAISSAAEVFRQDPAIDVVTGDCRAIDEGDRSVRDLPSTTLDAEVLLSGNSIPQPGLFFRRSAVEAAGGLDTNLHYVFDWALLLRMWINGCECRHLRRHVANFRVWNASKTVGGGLSDSLWGGARFAEERLAVLDGLVQHPPAGSSSELRAALLEAKRSSLLELALLSQLENRPEGASSYLADYAASGPAPARELPHAGALAAHLAYFDGDADAAILHFTESLSACWPGQIGARERASWERDLGAQVQQVQGWHQVHLRNYGAASARFWGAIRRKPTLLFERKHASPALKHLLLWMIERSRPVGQRRG